MTMMNLTISAIEQPSVTESRIQEGIAIPSWDTILPEIEALCMRYGLILEYHDVSDETCAIFYPLQNAHQVESSGEMNQRAPSEQLR